MNSAQPFNLIEISWKSVVIGKIPYYRKISHAFNEKSTGNRELDRCRG